jgi:hypothetical protein
MGPHAYFIYRQAGAKGKLKICSMPNKITYLSDIVSYELRQSALDVFHTIMDRNGPIKFALEKSVSHVLLKSNLKNRYQVKIAIANEIIEKPKLMPGASLHDYAREIIDWKRPDDTTADLRNKLRYEIQPTHKKIYNYITGLYSIKQYLVKNSGQTSLFLFSLWGLIFFSFYMNDTYSIVYNGQTYLKDVNSRIYNDFVYKLPNDYGSRIISGTTQKYFGFFPEWTIVVIYFGFFIIGFISFRISEIRKNTY